MLFGRVSDWVVHTCVFVHSEQQPLFLLQWSGFGLLGGGGLVGSGGRACSLKGGCGWGYEGKGGGGNIMMGRRAK